MWVFRCVLLCTHLLLGLLICALVFPFLSYAGRDRWVRRWSRVLLRVCRVEWRLAAESVPLDPRALLVANHVSWLDIFLINSLYPYHFVAKADIRGWPLIGWLAEQAGTIFLSRGRQRDVRRIYEGVVERIRAGRRVAFFPEGTTAAQGQLLPFHANLFEAAIVAEVPVQALAVCYRDAHGQAHPAADFIGEMSFVESILTILRATSPLRAEIRCLSPLPSQGAHRRTLAQSARDQVAQSLSTIFAAPP